MFCVWLWERCFPETSSNNIYQYSSTYGCGIFIFIHISLYSYFHWFMICSNWCLIVQCRCHVVQTKLFCFCKLFIIYTFSCQINLQFPIRVLCILIIRLHITSRSRCNFVTLYSSIQSHTNLGWFCRASCATIISCKCC